MKLLADENLDFSVIARLREIGHEVLAVVEMESGISDDLVLATANAEAAILVTEDKDFGELAFRLTLVHQGVILLRLAGLPAARKAEILTELLESHSIELPGSFTVVSPGLVRIRKPESMDDL
jgi:predicted nuclease of predicted toxin-antitoxin system